MSFNPAIPAPTDRPTISQGQILTNFSQLNTIFANNHVSFIAAADRGKHNFCQFPEQAAAPVTAANEGAIYTKVGASATTEAFFRRESNGAELQMTGLPVVVAGPVRGIITPWGLRMNWGSVVATGGGMGALLVTYAVPFTAGGGWSITVSKAAAAITTTSVGVANEVNASFNLYAPAGDVFYFFAIGV